MPLTSPGQSTSSHACFQFLNSVLSRPNAVPYDEDLKWSIRQQLVNVVQHFPGLQARTNTYTHNDGRTVSLLQADGTIPMYYQDVKYNIPVTIWLLEAFPRQAPLVYVTPTRDMIIKPRHRHVDPSGLVSVAYLQQWVFPRSNLVELVQSLSLHFGQDPPLYTRPSGSSVQQQQQQQQFQGMNPIYSTSSPQSSATTTSSSTSGANSALGPVYPPPYFQQQQQPQQQQPSSTTSASASYTEDPAEVFRRNAVSTLTERLHQDVLAVRRSCEGEMDELFNVQSMLNQRAEQLNKHVQELQQEKEVLEQQLQLVLTNTDALETWLKANDRSLQELDVDAAFEPVDVLSKQMLECSAEDLAIEDSLYALDKAVQQGVISAEAYLKHTRALSREQFFYRATSAKVRAAQLQLVASRPQPPYVL